ncbi:Conserved_hypothetical protein [Hexamita inflata]|uniref:Uncharacterized protein n=1 Tax=Hexamita inflata TaxID=28002 RepID=A0AA86TJB4_9EUKA|nr:Conserved hypothetical protein [Hexamita inflata]
MKTQLVIFGDFTENLQLAKQFVDLLINQLKESQAEVFTVQLQPYPPFNNIVQEQIMKEWNIQTLDIQQTTIFVTPSKLEIYNSARQSVFYSRDTKTILSQIPRISVTQQLLQMSQQQLSQFFDTCFLVDGQKSLYRFKTIPTTFSDFLYIFIPQEQSQTFANVSEYKQLHKAALHPHQPLLLYTASEGFDSSNFPANTFKTQCLQAPIASDVYIQTEDQLVQDWVIMRQSPLSQPQLGDRYYHFNAKLFLALNDGWRITELQKCFKIIKDSTEVHTYEQNKKPQFMDRRDKLRKTGIQRLGNAIQAVETKQEQISNTIETIQKFKTYVPVNILSQSKGILLDVNSHRQLNSYVSQILRGLGAGVYASLGDFGFLIDNQMSQIFKWNMLEFNIKSYCNKKIFDSFKDRFQIELEQVRLEESILLQDYTPYQHVSKEQETLKQRINLVGNNFEQMQTSFGLNILNKIDVEKFKNGNELRGNEDLLAKMKESYIYDRVMDE